MLGITMWAAISGIAIAESGDAAALMERVRLASEAGNPAPWADHVDRDWNRGALRGVLSVAADQGETMEIVALECAEDPCIALLSYPGLPTTSDLGGLRAASERRGFALYAPLTAPPITTWDGGWTTQYPVAFLGPASGSQGRVEHRLRALATPGA
jgi:hypothetical protein